MIEKIIHYAWVGDSPLSDLALDCIKSWKKYCPDYEIKEWNNKSLEKIRNEYLQEAYTVKKWAFVSDYIRLYALYNYGGFFFDTDLELTNSIEQFRKHSFVSGWENFHGNFSPITAFMGVEKNNKIIKSLLDEYETLHFIKDGKLDLTTNTSRITKYLRKEFNIPSPRFRKKYTVKEAETTINLDKNSVIYPYYYFCTPTDGGGEENFSIHHFNGSWVEPYRRKDMLSIKKFKLVSIKKNLDKKDAKLPLKDGEKIIFSFKTSKKKKICLLETD